MLSNLILNAAKSIFIQFRLGLIVLLILVCVFSIANSANRFRPINVEITTHLGDKQTFLKDDSISFLLSLDTDAHLLVIYEDAGGNLIQLIPNNHFNKTLYRAGLFIPLPDQNTAFKFKVQAPFGKETLWVFASDVPLPELEGDYLESGLKRISQDIARIKILLNKHKQTAFGETKLIIHTKDRN